MIDIVLGLQWGDEGKGKIVDYLADKYPIVARFQGGPNAGHSLHFQGKSHVLNTIPSGVFRENCVNIIGAGVVVDPVKLLGEIKRVVEAGADAWKNLRISRKAHLILPTHIGIDAASELAAGAGKIGSTLRGIGPTYQDKAGRRGIRFGDIFQADFEKRCLQLATYHEQVIAGLGGVIPDESQWSAWFEAAEMLRKIEAIDAEYFIEDALKNNQRILAEGAQGTMLDLDYGTYPFVTSSNTISSGACTGLGVSPSKIRKVYGVFKAYCTRVGSGPFPSELIDDTGELLRQKGKEFGATTGRPRRTGWLDLPALTYAIMLDGITDLMMTKADVLSGFQEVGLCSSYQLDGNNIERVPYDLCDPSIQPVWEYFEGWGEKLNHAQNFSELPQEFLTYLKHIESRTGVPVSMVSTGPEREKTLLRQ